jgi:hypothetical protein
VRCFVHGVELWKEDIERVEVSVVDEKMSGDVVVMQPVPAAALRSM